MSHPHIPPLARRLTLASLLAAACLVLLPSCGGGGGGGNGGVDTGGTGSFASGRITGFGSVIVNGVRFEDNEARVSDDDDEANGLRAQDLRLGMVVRIEAGAVTPGSGDNLPSARASAISVESQVKGPVESKTVPDTLVVMGQTVRVNAATVFDGTSFAAIVPGDVLEVSGFANAAGVVTATRIERENGAGTFKVRGVIANLDPLANTFSLGTATFDFSNATRLPSAALANGQFVRVRTQPARTAAGAWIVTRIDARRVEDEDRDEAKVEGTLLVNAGGGFLVNGVPVDLSQVPAGTIPALGRRVEVEGRLVNGVLVARKIELEDEDEDARVDVRGAASAVNQAAQTFVVRGVTFHYTAATTQQKDGTVAADLIDGANVRVRGTLPIAGSGPVEATEIDFRP